MLSYLRTVHVQRGLAPNLVIGFMNFEKPRVLGKTCIPVCLKEWVSRGGKLVG